MIVWACLHIHGDYANELAHSFNITSFNRRQICSNFARFVFLKRSRLKAEIDNLFNAFTFEHLKSKFLFKFPCVFFHTAKSNQSQTLSAAGREWENYSGIWRNERKHFCVCNCLLLCPKLRKKFGNKAKTTALFGTEIRTSLSIYVDKMWGTRKDSWDYRVLYNAFGFRQVIC